MGAVGGLLGIKGGAGGTGFAGPAGANINNPVTQGQIDTSYKGVQGGFDSQQALLQALQGQNGIGNQSQVYNQLQGIANGTGPNPAQAMLANSTGQNVANQAALMGGQRGAGANIGLMARQIGQQGAGIQQNAAGQAAALQAQQSLGAINSMGGIANTQAANQIGQTNANLASQQSEQQSLLNAMAQYNSTQAGLQANINSSNAGLANTTMTGQQNLIGGLTNAIGGGAKAAAGAGGGELVSMADGGDASAFSGSGPQSKFGQFIVGGGAPISAPVMEMPQLQAPAAQQWFKNGIGGGGQKPILTGAAQDPGTGAVDAIASPGAGAMFSANGGTTDDYRGGGKVNAKGAKQKAVAPGNNYANDKIPAVLSEHEIVLPRSVTLSDDPVNNAAKFVASVMAKRRAGKK